MIHQHLTIPCDEEFILEVDRLYRDDSTGPSITLEWLPNQRLALKTRFIARGVPSETVPVFTTSSSGIYKADMIEELISRIDECRELPIDIQDRLLAILEETEGMEDESTT